MIDATIQGIQEEQARNLQRIADIKPSGAIGQAVRDALVVTHAYVVDITHVDTGALRAAHRMDYAEEADAATGRISIDESAVNPNDQRPAEYGLYEHARGGEHAFYARGISEAGYGAIADSGQALAIRLTQ